MFNNFLDTIKNQLQNQLSGATGLSPDKASQSAEVTAETFKETISEKARQGNLDEIASLARPGAESSGFANNIISNTISKLTTKVGLPPEVATKVAGIAIPFIISKFKNFSSQNTKDDQSDIMGIFGDLVGDKGKGLLGGLGKKFGF
ncbi:MAG TPA: hypothetical protein VFD91_12410 [Mariniphaga sp.]|nr:hypothetical protein [Mariniphaga sp.]